MQTAFIRHLAFTTVATLITLTPGLATRVAAQALYYGGAQGPVVLPVDRDSGLPVPVENRGDLSVDRAVPVPSVMNGSGFGLTGTDYYSDGLHEGALRGRTRAREFVLAPALRAPPHRLP